MGGHAKKQTLYETYYLVYVVAPKFFRKFVTLSFAQETNHKYLAFVQHSFITVVCVCTLNINNTYTISSQR